MSRQTRVEINVGDERTTTIRTGYRSLLSREAVRTSQQVLHIEKDFTLVDAIEFFEFLGLSDSATVRQFAYAGDHGQGTLMSYSCFEPTTASWLRKARGNDATIAACAFAEQRQRTYVKPRETDLVLADFDPKTLAQLAESDEIFVSFLDYGNYCGTLEYKQDRGSYGHTGRQLRQITIAPEVFTEELFYYALEAAEIPLQPHEQQFLFASLQLKK